MISLTGAATAALEALQKAQASFSGEEGKSEMSDWYLVWSNELAHGGVRIAPVIPSKFQTPAAIAAMMLFP